MSEVIGIIATVLAVSGCVMNNRRRRVCFGLWIISNILCGWLHFETQLWSLLVRDVIFSALAVEGWILWNNEKGNNDEK